METIWQDLRFAVRQLRRSPGFAVTAVLTLALGIGANTAIFSLLDQALLRSLPVRDPGSLVVLEGTGKLWEGHSSSHGGDQEAYFSYPMYRDLQADNGVFAGLIASAPAKVGLVQGNAAQMAEAELVSGNYFSLLGVRAALGRMLTQADDAAPGANPVAVVSYDFWRDHLAANPAVVGSAVSLNGHPYQVIGVAAPGFHSAVWGQTPNLFVPMAMLDQMVPGQGKRLTDHTDKWMNIFGRLKPGVTVAQAEAGVAPLWHALRAEELGHLGKRSPRFVADFLTDSRLHVLPGARGFSYSREGFERPFLAVMAMALLVLIIASANVASLLLVRSAGRVREFAVRSALGASRGRLVRQLLMEGLLIGAAGGAVGLLLAPVALRALVAQLTDPTDGSSSFSASLDMRVLLFSYAVALGVSLLFSLAPTAQLRRREMTTTLRESSTTGSGALALLRRGVVTLQIGLSVILLVGAGLFLRTMQQLRAAQPGFAISHVLSFATETRLSGYAAAEAPALNQRVLDAVGALPGVQGVAANSIPELGHHDRFGNVRVAGYVAPHDDPTEVDYFDVSPNYLELMRVPLVAGRQLTEADDMGHPQVGLVNEAFVRHFCGGSAQACVGRQIATNGDDRLPLDITVVGVARDYRHDGVREDVVLSLYRPLKQRVGTTGVTFYVRTLADPAATLATVRAGLRTLDPNLVVNNLETMDQHMEEELGNERLIALLAAAFAGLATLLAGVGLYGVLAFSTAQRTREIGIRMALGSSRGAVAQLVLRDVVGLAGLGVALALPAAWALSRLVQAQLYGVSATDPLILGGVLLLITTVALLAALVPARRAAAVMPVVALRTE